MEQFCKNCNFELEEKFNFCPSCGTEINAEDQNFNHSDNYVVHENVDFILCNECGEENDCNKVFCNGCGIKLGDFSKKITKRVETPKAKLDSSEKKRTADTIVQKKNNKQKKNVVEESTNKIDKQSVDQTNLFMIIGGVVLLGVIILYSAGVFDSHSVGNPGSSVQNQQNQSAQSIDMNKLQKINQMRDFVAQNPSDFKALLDFSHLLMDARIFTEAIESYKKYLEKDPKNVDVIVDMAVCYFELKQFDKAIKLMEKGIIIDPKHQIGHLNLGVVNLSKGDVEAANQWFKKAIEINPTSEVAQKARHLLESH